MDGDAGLRSRSRGAARAVRLIAQGPDVSDDAWARPGAPMRPRTALGQAVGDFSPIPGDPLAHGARKDARGGGDEAYRQVVVEHAVDQPRGATSSARLAGVVLEY